MIWSKKKDIFYDYVRSFSFPQLVNYLSERGIIDFVEDD
jgi:hypothetical protein